MNQDKYSATWVSYSSISDFLSCKRAYYLKNIYKRPTTGHKIQIISPPLALGGVVHEVLEQIADLPTSQRFINPLTTRLAQLWPKISGKQGGFTSSAQEKDYKDRAETMLANVQKHPGPLEKLALKLKGELPYYWLSQSENLILCGKIDWLEYLSEVNSIHIIDFKTGKGLEKDESFQLPIYCLLANNCQDREVIKASYWYIEKDHFPKEKKLPDLSKAKEKVLAIAKNIKLARKLGLFKCKLNGCSVCKPYELILKEKAEYVGTNSYKSDMFILKDYPDRKEEAIIH